MRPPLEGVARPFSTPNLTSPERSQGCVDRRRGRGREEGKWTKRLKGKVGNGNWTKERERGISGRELGRALKWGAGEARESNPEFGHLRTARGVSRRGLGARLPGSADRRGPEQGRGEERKWVGQAGRRRGRAAGEGARGKRKEPGGGRRPTAWEAGGGRGTDGDGRGRAAWSPRAAASLSAGRRCRLPAPQRRALSPPSRPQAAAGPGLRGSQRRLLCSGPSLLRLARRRQRRRQRSDPCGHHRPRQQAPRAEPLSSRRRRPWLPASCSRPRRSAAASPAPALCACARPAPRPRSLTAHAGCFPRRPGTWAGDTSLCRRARQAGAAMKTHATATPVHAL